jgi:hypothetical protein
MVRADGGAYQPCAPLVTRHALNGKILTAFPGTLRFKEAEPDHATAFVFRDTEGELWLCYTSVDLEHGISTLRMPGQVPRSVDVPEPKR